MLLDSGDLVVYFIGYVIAIFTVHRFEFAAANGNNRIRKNIHLATQSDVVTTDFFNTFNIVHSKVSNRFEVRLQALRVN